MTYNPRIHNRHSIRLPEFDYRQFGAYFLTICTYEKDPIFGRVYSDAVHLTEFGRAVEHEWSLTGKLHDYVATDTHVVMPNHFHGIIWLRRNVVGAQRAAPLRADAARLSNVQPQSLGAVVRGFKSASTKRINELRATPGSPVWQRNYYERVLRNDEELCRAQEYINYNPLKWSEDPNHI